MSKLYHVFMAGSEGGANLSSYLNLTVEDLFDLIYCPDIRRYPEVLNDDISDEDLLVYYYKIQEEAFKDWDEAYVSLPEVFNIENGKLRRGYPSAEEKIEYIKLKIKEWKSEN